jgi:negative regulator of flagellin synthesis FlgM
MASRIGDGGQSTDVVANRQLNTTTKAGGSQNLQGINSAKSQQAVPVIDNQPVALSADARGRAAEMQKAKQIAQNTPDVREDKIAAIKERIQNGTYQIDSGLIADGLLREAIRDHLTMREDR